MTKRILLALAALTATLAPASAHVTLETQEAKVGSSYKAVFRVGHGCEGAPTTTLRVRIPDGVISVKPMPKAGWEIETKTEPYGKTFDYYGTPLTEGVREVVWSGGSLPDAFYDEFVMRVYLTPDLATGEKLWFPVVQECPDGKAERWIEIPEAGKTADDYGYPAAGVTLLPKN